MTEAPTIYPGIVSPRRKRVSLLPTVFRLILYGVSIAIPYVIFFHPHWVRPNVIPVYTGQVLRVEVTENDASRVLKTLKVSNKASQDLTIVLDIQKEK